MTVPATVREAAAFYIAHGFRVVPLFGVDEQGRCRCSDPACKPRDAGKHARAGVEEEAKDGVIFSPEAFSEWDNISLMMGPHGGDWLVALDFDGDFAKLSDIPPPMVPTLEQSSPRGHHLIYSVPAYTPLGNWVDCFATKARGYSMDLRYARGRIVVAPSRGATGAYRWVDWREPARLPQLVIDLILNERRRRRLPVLPRWQREGKKP